MSGHPEISVIVILLLVLLGAVLAALLAGLARLLRDLPLSPGRRDALDRALPVIKSVAWLTYMLGAIPVVFDGHPRYTPIATTLVLLGVVVVSWFAIRDFVAGVVLRAGRVLSLGDHLTLDGASGEVVRLGFRVLEIRAASGQAVVLPYSRIVGVPIARAPAADGVYRPSFSLPPVAADRASAVLRDAEAAAWLCHWSSAGRPPRFELRRDGGIDVTVHAVEPAHGPDIEAVVRAAAAAAAEARQVSAAPQEMH